MSIIMNVLTVGLSMGHKWFQKSKSLVELILFAEKECKNSFYCWSMESRERFHPIIEMHSIAILVLRRTHGLTGCEIFGEKTFRLLGPCTILLVCLSIVLVVLIYL